MRNINYKDPTFKISDHLRGMSYENLVKFAKEDPIIPIDDYKNAMSDTVGYASDIQAYGTAINAQPDVKLEEIPDIIPSQELARENVNNWFNKLNPKIIGNYTGVIQYCNFYGSLKESDVDSLVDNISTASGKEDFIAVMNEFEHQTKLNVEHVTSTSSDLVSYNSSLAGDLRNFQTIKNDADALYIGDKGILKSLQDDMARYKGIIDQCNVAIAATSTFLGLGILAIGVGVFLAFTGPGIAIPYLIFSGGLIIGSVSGGLLGAYVEKKAEAETSYKKAAVEFKTAQTQCATLQALSDNFTALGEANSKASGAGLKMINAWQNTGQQFSGLASIAKEAVDENTKVLIKLKLKGAIEDVKTLNAFAKTCQENGILPVIPDKELIRNLRLPNSWLNKNITGTAFRDFVYGMRTKGYYDRGRKGWRSRAQQICISA